MFGRKKLQATIKKQETEIASLKDKRERWREGTIENQGLHKQNAELRSEITKLQTKVREQTEADLFFASMQICFDLLNGKTKQDIYAAGLAERQREMQSRLALQMAAGPPAGYPYPSALFGGLFGRY